MPYKQICDPVAEKTFTRMTDANQESNTCDRVDTVEAGLSMQTNVLKNLAETLKMS